MVELSTFKLIAGLIDRHELKAHSGHLIHVFLIIIEAISYKSPLKNAIKTAPII